MASYASSDPLKQQYWHLWPNKSLTRKGRIFLATVFISLLGGGALRAFFLGAWPVAVFILADLIAILLAFFLVARRSAVSEKLILTRTSLIVERWQDRKPQHRVSFNPHQLEIYAIDNKATNERYLRLQDSAQSIAIAHWLTCEEHHQLKKDIDRHLERWRTR